MNGTELHAELHVATFTLADIRAEQEAQLARFAALRARLEGALQRSRECRAYKPRFIEDLRGVVVCED